jgi:hypothetical protein
VIAFLALPVMRLTARTPEATPFGHQWDKLRRTQCEQISSELPLKADIT